MIDRASAKSLALKHVQELYGAEPEIAVVEGEPVETVHAWIFFYNAKRYLETGEFSHALAGNGPILVNKSTSAIEMFGTAVPFEILFADYDARQSLNG